MRADSTIQASLAIEIFIRRRKKVLVPQSSPQGPRVDERAIATIAKNLEMLGYAMSQDLIDACRQSSFADLEMFYKDLVACLEKHKGAHRRHQPMYFDFPRQVMEMDEAELYLNALVHYLTSGKFLPSQSKKSRKPLIENTKLEVLRPGSLAEFERLFTQLVSANTSLSEQDKEDISWFINHYGNRIVTLLPGSVPNRENKAFVLGRLIRYAPDAASVAVGWCSTATDVLRVAVAMSEGDVSLAKATKFKRYSRPERAKLLELLNSQSNLVEDMLRWKSRWIRLGEKLHPGEKKNTFPNAFSAFDVLRNDLPTSTFYGRLEQYIKSRNTEFIELLAKRPGDFARRLDHLLRISPGAETRIIEAFARVADRVSTPVLLQLMHHFKVRNNPRELRVFFPKGDTARAKAIMNVLDNLDQELCNKITGLCQETLKRRFAKLPPLGACYLDRSLKNYMVPFSQRSASKALKTVSRLSRIELGVADTLRFFIWWRNQPNRRVDIDLSAVAFDSNFYFKSAITYYNLKDLSGCHSGDIVDAPEGASEYIDISLSRCLQSDIFYIVMVITSYSGQPYCDLPECFAGWMGRKSAQSGEIYDPRTVQNKFDVSSNSRLVIPAVFDVVQRQAIWTDVTLPSRVVWNNNVGTNLEGIQLALRAMTEISKPNLYDLLKLHTEARGHLVEHPENATHVFSVANETPYQLETIASDYMSD